MKGYEYGQDALRLWNCLHKFYTSIIETEFKDDNAVMCKSVKNDVSLQSWVKYIKEIGLMKTFPDLNTNADLINTVTSIVFQLSVQHTAINYTHSYFYGFSQNAPACIYNWEKLTDWQGPIGGEMFAINPHKILLNRRLGEILSAPPAREDTLISILNATGSFYKLTKFDSPRSGLLSELLEFEKETENHDKNGYKVFNPKTTLAGEIFA